MISKYRKLKKKKSIRIQFFNFVNKVKTTNKGHFYKKVKEIGGLQPAGSGELRIECLEGKSDLDCSEEVARAFAAVSCKYQPVDTRQLPAYLPALAPPLGLANTSLPEVKEIKKYQKHPTNRHTKSIKKGSFI